MQTEEETAAAEEPILEEGSEREQVNGMTFDSGHPRLRLS